MNLRTTLASLLVFLSVAFYNHSQDIYYWDGTGFVNDLSTWYENPNGTGAQPANFIDNNQEFHIIDNNAVATLDNDWIVGGSGTPAGPVAKVVLGNGTDPVELIVPDNHVMEAFLDIKNEGLATLQNETIPDLDSLYDGSTVNYQMDATYIRYSNYYNVEIENIDPTFDVGQPGTISIRKDLNLIGNVTFPEMRDLDHEVTLRFHESLDQNINTNGNVVRGFDVEIEKPAGSLDLNNGDLSADNNLSLNLTGSSSFNDNGNSIYSGNNLFISGDAGSYNLTGEFVLAGIEPGIVKGVGNGNNFVVSNNAGQSIDVPLNDLHIKYPNAGGTFNFLDGGTNDVIIEGTLIFGENVDGNIDFNNNQLKIRGDFEIESGFSNSGISIDELVFDGNANSSFIGNYGDLEVNDFTVDKTGGEVTLNDDITVTGDINLMNGIVNTSNSGAVYLATSGSIANSGNNSYFNGPMYSEVDVSANVNLDFPIGKGGAYRPVNVEIEQATSVNEWYFAEVFDGTPPNNTNLELGLQSISNNRYFQIGQVGSTVVEDIIVTLNYGAGDNIANASEARVAYQDGSEWINLGGNANGAPNGDVTSVVTHDDLGLYAVASVDPNPFIYTNPSSFNFFTQDLGIPSPEQSIDVAGSNLNDDIEITAGGNYEISLNSGGTFSNSLTLSESGGEVAPTTIFVRLNRGSLGTETEQLDLSTPGFGGQQITLDGEAIDPFQPGDDLLYYWHFNELSASAPGVTQIPNNFSYLDDYDAMMTYTAGSGDVDLTDDEDGSSINTQLTFGAGKAVAVNNRSDDRSLLFEFNTSEASDLVFEYAAKRSPDGMLNHDVEYSTNGGQSFSTTNLLQTSFAMSENYELVRVNLAGVNNANDNEDFQIRVNFAGNTVQLNGYNLIDNVSLKGDGSLSTQNFDNKTSMIEMYPNPATAKVNISSSKNFEAINIVDITGRSVVSNTYNQVNNATVDISSLPVGAYVVNVSGEAGVKQLKLIKN